MSTSISENISKTRRRGRPPSQWLASELQIAGGLGVDLNIHSRRGKQNCVWRQRAIGVLLNHPDASEFSWLADGQKMREGTHHAWQPTILAELGRIDDDDLLIVVARELCERQPRPKVRRAVALIRQCRLGRQPKADTKQLAHSIALAIDNYASEHEVTDARTILDALEHVARIIEHN